MIKKDPTKSVLICAIMTGIIAILSLILTFKDVERANYLFPVQFISLGLFFVYFTFKHQQKRIDALEEKLNEQNQQGEEK